MKRTIVPYHRLQFENWLIIPDNTKLTIYTTIIIIFSLNHSGYWKYWKMLAVAPVVMHRIVLEIISELNAILNAAKYFETLAWILIWLTLHNGVKADQTLKWRPCLVYWWFKEGEWSGCGRVTGQHLKLNFQMGVNASFFQAVIEKPVSR